MGMPNTATLDSRPSLQSKHGLSSCFKGSHGSLTSEPTSVLDLATMSPASISPASISPASSPGTSPRYMTPNMGAPSLHKSILHRSYHLQNSRDSSHEANFSQGFRQSNAYGDRYVISSSPNNCSFITSSYIGGCASSDSCDGPSFAAQNEMLQVMESLDDLECVVKPQIHIVEDILTENVPLSMVVDEHHLWDEPAFGLLSNSDEFLDVQDSFSCLDEILSFKIEEEAAPNSMYGSPDNSLKQPFTTNAHLHSPVDKIEIPYSHPYVAETTGSSHMSLKEVETSSEDNVSGIVSLPIVPQSFSTLHTQRCMCITSLQCDVKGQVYNTNSSHVCVSEIPLSSSDSYFSNEEQLVGRASSLGYTIERRSLQSNTCDMLQSIHFENPWINSGHMPKDEEYNTGSTKQETQISTQYQEEEGLQLVHLLLLCAETISERKYNTVYSLLRKLHMMSSSEGNPLERIAFHFSEVLLKRVADILQMKDFNESMHFKNTSVLSVCPTSHEQMEIDAFYFTLYQALPYSKFLHFTANQAILEAVEDSSRIHVIDFDIQQGMQWPNFFQSLVGRARGPPRSIKLSAIGSSMRRLNQTGRMLSEFAQSLSLNFIFHPIVIRDVKELNVGMFTTKRHGHYDDVHGVNDSFPEEAIALNLPAILHSQLWEEVTTEAFLMLVNSLHPKVVSVMKAEKHNEAPSYVHKFIEVLFYYSAFFDSLELAMDRKSVGRAKIERVLSTYGLNNMVSYTGEWELAMGISTGKWQEIMEKAGFYSTQFSDHAIYQAKLLLGLYASDAFRIEGSHTTTALSINWKETPLFVVMAFSPAPLGQVF